jgi:hypothetical protein
MVHRFFHRQTSTGAQPDFPTAADLPSLTTEEADEALSLLRLMMGYQLAEVYTQPVPDPVTGRRFFNVWLTERLVRGGRRVELREWAWRVIGKDEEEYTITLTDAGRAWLRDHPDDAA